MSIFDKEFKPRPRPKKKKKKESTLPKVYKEKSNSGFLCGKNFVKILGKD